jgi:flavin reductase (DIM6/NTAB) family NADH-FMN oxidoreductase RutF
MYSVEPKELSQIQVQSFLTGGVAPRPIALVSTISSDGIPNLSPFSFYNSFGSNPPVVAFSASRRGKDGSLKDTYNNLMSTGECVVNAVTELIMENVNLSSTEYPAEIDEWIKCGLTPIQSDLVRPFRALESPFQMECRLHQMVNVGDNPGSANIAICEVIKFHIDDSILVDGKIDPLKISHIGRNGAEYWTRSNKDSMFILKKPMTSNSIGFDGLPDFIRNSKSFTRNEIARFGLLEKLPAESEMYDYIGNHKPVHASYEDFISAKQLGDTDQLIGIALFLKSDQGILETVASELLNKYLIKEAYCLCLYNYLNNK